MTSAETEADTHVEVCHPARLNGVFLVTPSVGSLRRYYEGLGWRSARTDDAFVPFPLTGGALALFDEEVAGAHLVELHAAGIQFDDVVLCTVVDRPEEVDAAAVAAADAGGRVVSTPASTPYGRATWIADPSDTVWEICWIDGMTSDAPFAGAPEPDALLPELGGVVVLTRDLAALTAFYVDGLGWPPTGAGGDDVVDLQLGGLSLSLRARDAEATDLDAARRALELPVRRTILTLTVPPAGLGDAVDELVSRGAVEVLSVDGASFLVDPAGLTWKLRER